MNLAFHIFKKDLRHHWFAALVSISILAAYVWDQPRHWRLRTIDLGILAALIRYLPLVLVLAWIFCIVRLVQDESLVGDRQYWLTRPYRWHTLLGAKLLDVIVLVHLPLFLAQILLLKLAFFPVLSSIPGLLDIQLMLFCGLTLPAIVVASITRGVGQASLVLLGALLVMLGLASLDAVFSNLDFSAADFESIEAVVALVAAISVVLVQFIYRKTWVSWCIIGAAAVAIISLMFAAASPYVLNRALPLPTAARPLPAKFSFDHSVSFRHESGEELNNYGLDSNIELPLLVEDLPENTLVKISGIKLELNLPTGEHWTSHWHSGYEVLVPGRTRLWPSTEIKRDVMNQIRNSSANAHLSLALDVYKASSGSSIFVRGDSLRLPEDTRCSHDMSPSRMRCFSALKSPGSFVLYADLPNANCSVPAAKHTDPWAAAPAFFASLSEPSVAEFDFTPVHESWVSLTRRSAYEDVGVDVPLCPGTPFVLARTKFQYTVRAEIDLGNIRISNYVPTYPREITPKIPRTPAHGPSDALSFNFPFFEPVALRDP